MAITTTTLITGASGGIGAALARQAAGRGHNLVLVGRDKKRLNSFADEVRVAYGVTTTAIVADLSVAGSVATLLAGLKKKRLNIDILINNAGFGLSGAFADQDQQRQRDMIGVNITAVTELTRALLPDMIKRKQGRVLNVASTAAFLPGPYMAEYYATKAYVLSLTRALSEELRGSGVTVTALCPGPTATEFAATAKVGGSKLFSRPMSATDVAAQGFAALMACKPVIVTGVNNQLTTWIPRFLPSSLMARIVAEAQKPTE